MIGSHQAILPQIVDHSKRMERLMDLQETLHFGIPIQELHECFLKPTVMRGITQSLINRFVHFKRIALSHLHCCHLRESPIIHLCLRCLHMRLHLIDRTGHLTDKVLRHHSILRQQNLPVIPLKGIERLAKQTGTDKAIEGGHDLCVIDLQGGQTKLLVCRDTIEAQEYGAQDLLQIFPIGACVEQITRHDIATKLSLRGNLLREKGLALLHQELAQAFQAIIGEGVQLLDVNFIIIQLLFSLSQDNGPLKIVGGVIGTQSHFDQITYGS